MDPFRNKWITVTLCTYEVTAILVKHTTGKDTIPTITRITQRHPLAGIVLTAAMGWHFFAARRAS